ncbi:MAG: polysaccharide deacetylase family protein [Flavobacteriales bacterium]
MNRFIAQLPRFLRKIYGSFLWRMEAKSKTLFLTFDDGPHPEITPWVLDVLHKEQIKAGFFLIGDMVRKSPRLLKRLQNEGHQIGNHTYHHLSAWSTRHKTYIENVALCDAEFESEWFRPPYGKLTPKKAKTIQASGKTIVMWDVLSGDFDPKLSGEDCLDLLKKHSRNGSIIVFHDSEKAEKNLRFALPKYITWAKEQGFDFGSLEKS